MSYSEMSDDELNERIYEAQGYEKLGFPAVPTWQKPSDDGLPRGLYHEPRYSTDLNAAFKLVDDPNIVSVNVDTTFDEHGRRKGWVCNLMGMYYGEHTATAATPARAISEAWLLYKAKEVQR
jgi:hypothetical protein